MTRIQLHRLRPGDIVTMSDGNEYEYIETRRHMVCLKPLMKIVYLNCEPQNSDTTPFWMDYRNI